MSKKQETSNSVVDDFAANLISDINKELKSNVASNLKDPNSVARVNQWISTNCIQVDYDIANKPNGGFPLGRVVEIFGLPASGKSHLAIQACISAQKAGGISILIDSEFATSTENLENLGIDLDKNFVYIEESCTEKIFEIVEKTILKARVMMGDRPVVIVWDSLAASSPKAELEGDYDKSTIGLQARALSKGMRKITQIISQQKVLFVIINQMRQKIDSGLYGDPWCVNPYYTYGDFTISNPEVAKAATEFFGYDCSEEFSCSFHEIALLSDNLLKTDLTSAYNREGVLPECYSPENINKNEIIEFEDITDLGLSIRGENGNFVSVEAFSVKNPVTEHYFIPGHNLYVSGGHRFIVEGREVLGCEYPGAERVSEPMPVVDITVAGEKYVAHGLVHHNTTPGGNAVPYHSSVRVKVNASKKIEGPDKETIGVTVSSNIIKNKVGFPHRKSMFEIHFGVGIIEDEYLFDAIRGDEPIVVDEDGNTVELSGTAAWKYFFVRDKNGKELIDIKFRKSGDSSNTSFLDLMKDPEYRPWIDKYIEKVLVKKPSPSNRLINLSPEELLEFKRGVVLPPE